MVRLHSTSPGFDLDTTRNQRCAVSSGPAGLPDRMSSPLYEDEKSVGPV